LCREHPLEEKWLIAPSLRVGHQWLDIVTRGGQAAVNVRVQTLAGMALSLAGGKMLQAGVKLLSPRSGAVLIGQLWTPQREGGYIFSLAPSQSLCQALFATVMDLRLAGKGQEDVLPEKAEVATKAEELASLLRMYKDELDRRGLMDYADALQTAAQGLKDTGEAEGSGLILLPADMELAALESRLIKAIPANRLIVLSVDEPGKVAGDDVTTDTTLLRWLLAPTDSPSPTDDGSAGVFHAVGEVNEIREVLRRCLAAGIPLDDVELLYTDAQTYLPLVYELAKRLDVDATPPATTGATASDGLKVTLAEGIPVRYSRPGRLLAAWLQWIAEDYPQSILVRILQDGLLEVGRGIQEDFSFAELARLLRTAPIGFGADRYLSRLDEQIAALERRLDAEQIPDENGEVDAGRPDRTRRQLAGVKVLRELVDQLLRVCPPRSDAPPATLRAALGLLDGLARCVGELDSLARVRLVEDIAEVADLLDETENQTGLDPWDYLNSLPGDLRVGGSGPRPGHMHCAHVLSGGHSGRGNTFIVGLDDQRFPGGGLQDPILLDGERMALSADLPTAGRNLRMQLENFARLLARLRGAVTLSYSSRGLVEDREAFPSPVLLAAFRILSGKPQGDQADLAGWLAPPASFVPTDPAGAIDPAEWWLWRTCGEQALDNPHQLVAEEFPHLGRGMLAADRRQSDNFTEFDGRVEDVGAEHDPASPNGPTLSPSGLETAGRCLLAYFFKYVLRIEPPDDLEVDPTRWLAPPTLGGLLHEVFCVFMRELVSADRLPPSYTRDCERLGEILSEHIGEYRRLIPPPNELAYRRQRRELEHAVRIFLFEEERYCQDRWPMYMEASIGLPASEDGTPLDSTEPVEVALGDDTTIRVRGRIDRVDRIGAPDTRTFAVWDYKTGSSWRFRHDPPFWQGRVLQHAVYLHLVTERLRQAEPEAAVAEVGYFFPGQRGRGERITYVPQDLDGGLAIVRRLCRAIARGAFLATDNAEDDCTWCDYAHVCGDTEATAQDAKRKLQSSDDLLTPLLELRGYDERE